MCCGPCCAIDNTSLFLALPAGDTNEGEAAVTRARSTLGVEDCNFHAFIPMCERVVPTGKGQEQRRTEKRMAHANQILESGPAHREWRDRERSTQHDERWLR